VVGNGLDWRAGKAVLGPTVGGGLDPPDEGWAQLQAMSSAANAVANPCMG
jgi:hypothetical protein